MDIQACITLTSITADCIYNENETAIFSCPELLVQYVPENAHRAVTLEDRGESRYTALLGSNAKGKMLPVMMILGVGCKNTVNLTTKRTLSKVRRELGLTTWTEVRTYICIL
jgi:hypothetical protein